ncbi:MAG: HNH endonuclease, partial [Desulfobacterales bacterium]|nr:HNH endonuclease [Desulfobacterales bacterium]
MTKIRSTIPAEIKRSLFIECGFKCSMPRCEHEQGLQIHHINGDPNNNELENLIVLCSVHHSLATNNKIDRKFCKQLKQILGSSAPIQKPYKETIHTRLQFLNKAIELIRENPASYRSTKIGPIFLHPSWWGIRRNNNIQSPDYENEVYNYILSNCKSRNHDIRTAIPAAKRFNLFKLLQIT